MFLFLRLARRSQCSVCIWFLICGCGPNRSATLSAAARQQASLATGAIGTEIR